MPALGPYSRATRLAHVDGRSREGRLLRSVRDELTNQIGNPSPAQKALIDRASWLSLRIAQLDDGMTERWVHRIRQKVFAAPGRRGRPLLGNTASWHALARSDTPCSFCSSLSLRSIEPDNGIARVPVRAMRPTSAQFRYICAPVRLGSAAGRA